MGRTSTDVDAGLPIDAHAYHICLQSQYRIQTSEVV